MPEMMPPAGAQAPPPPAAGGQPPGGGQTPPMGSTSATGPTPNKGYEAAVVQTLGVFINKLTDMFKMVGAGSDIGKDILKIINIAAKHVPPGTVTPAGEKNTIEQMALKNAQNGQQMAALKQQPAGGGQPPGGGAPPPQMPQAA